MFPAAAMVVQKCAAALAVQKRGREELPQILGQEWQPRENTLLPRYGAVVALYWSMHEEIPHVQGKRNPSKTVGTEKWHQREDRLKPHSQTTSQSVTRTTGLSNSMELSHAVWGNPRWTGHGGDV